MHNTKQGALEDVPFEEAMDIAGFGKFSMFIILISGLAIGTSLLAQLDVSLLLPAAQCDLELTSQDKGLLTSAYFIGTITASHISGYLADTLGRKYVLVRGLSLNFLTYILGSFAPNFWLFFTIKVLSGIVTCPAMIATMPLLGEYVPSKRRAQALLISTSISTIGLLYSAVVGWLTLQATWTLDLWFITFTPWRLFFILCGIPSLVSGVLLHLTPESPRFMLTRGKREDTLKVLQRVHSVNSGKVLGSYPVNSVIMDASEVPAPNLAKGKGVMQVLKHIGGQTLPLFKPPHVKNLTLCIVLMVVVCLCVHAAFLWMPEITNRMTIYQETHEGRFSMCEMVQDGPHLSLNITSETTSSTTAECISTINTTVFVSNILISLTQPIIMLVASVFVPMFDRRIVSSVLLILCGSMAFLITLARDSYVVILLYGGMPILSGLCYNVLISITIDIFPTYIRAMAVSVTMVCGRLGAIIGSQLFSLMLDTQCSLLFKLVSGTLLCCAVVPFFFQRKPTDKTKASSNGELSDNKT